MLSSPPYSHVCVHPTPTRVSPATLRLTHECGLTCRERWTRLSLRRSSSVLVDDHPHCSEAKQGENLSDRNCKKKKKTLFSTGLRKRKVKSLSRVHLFATPTDCSLPGSSVHGISQARMLEWVAIAFSRGSSRTRDRTRVSRILGRRFTV